MQTMSCTAEIRIHTQLYVRDVLVPQFDGYKCARQQEGFDACKEGSNWYDCRTTADLILDEASSIRLKIKKTGEKADCI